MSAPRMAELILVRHAETDWSGLRYCGRTDLPLNPAGLIAARSLAAQLARDFGAESEPGAAPVVRVVSSPRRRAYQTAEALIEALPGSSLTIDDRWSEVDFGVVEGLTFDELTRSDPGLAEHLLAGVFAVDWPGGEPASAFQARVAAAFHEAGEGAVPTIVVSHGGPIRLAMAIGTGRDPGEVVAPEPGHAWHRPADAPGGARRRPVIRFPV